MFGDLPPLLDDPFEDVGIIPPFIFNNPIYDAPPPVMTPTIYPPIYSSNPFPNTQSGSSNNSLTSILNTILGATANIFKPRQPVTSLTPGVNNQQTGIVTRPSTGIVTTPAGSSGITISTSMLLIGGLAVLAFLSGRK
jgi:hypothetical protein